MDNYNEVYKSICRVCLSHSAYQNMVSLCDTLSVDGLSCYGKLVVNFANIKLDSNQNLPIMMCTNCLILLKQAVLFKCKCESSDLQLKKLMSINNKNEDYKKTICEYTIFKHYFPEECTPAAATKTNNGSGGTNIVINNHKSGETYTGQQNGCDLSPQKDDKNLTSNYQNGLDDIDMCDTDSETCDNTDYSDALFDKLETMINSNLIVDTPIYRRRSRNFKKKRFRKEDFKCTICDKQLTSRLTFDRHMQRHNGCRYMCEGCAKAFPTVAELNVHQVATHGIGPHLKCHHCPFKAARKITLIEHIRLHTGERPYTCEKCGLTFRRKAIYRNHLVHHDEKKIQCPHCPKMFYRRCAMLTHMNNIHERLYVYVCNKCGVTYTKNVTVRRHLAEKHGIPREMQGKIERIRKGDTGLHFK